MIDLALTALAFLGLGALALMALEPFITDHIDPPHRRR